MLPEPDDGPAGLVESRVGRPVTLDVAAQLRFPVPAVGRRLAAVLGAAVPEAAVYENRDPPGGEYDVGPHSQATGQIEPVILSVPISQAVQRPAERKLGFGVG